MDEEEIPRRVRRWNFVFWLACIWLVGWVGIILWQSISWTDTRSGFFNGILVGGIVSPLVLLVTVPAGVLGMAAGHLRILRGHSLACSIALPCVLSLVPATMALMDRADPGRRLERFTGIRLPPGVRIESATFRGGLFALREDRYVLTSSPEASGNLMQLLSFQPGYGKSAWSRMEGFGFIDLKLLDEGSRVLLSFVEHDF